jgi:hypothetical protein
VTPTPAELIARTEQYFPSDEDVQRAASKAFGRAFTIEARLKSRNPDHLSYVGHSGDNQKRSILHVLPAADLLFDEELRLESKHVAPQEDRLVEIAGMWRRFVIRAEMDAVLSDVQDLEQYFGKSDASAALETRLGILEQVLEGLTEIHRSGRFHGDLREQNVGLDTHGASRLVDPFFRVSSRNSSAIRSYLVGGEVNEPQSQEEDVFAFGMLAQRMLGTRRWDNRELPTKYPGFSSAAFEWILDYCTTVEPSNRPSTEVLLDLIFGDRGNTLRTARHRLIRAEVYVQQFFRRTNGTKYLRLVSV